MKKMFLSILMLSCIIFEFSFASYATSNNESAENRINEETNSVANTSAEQIKESEDSNVVSTENIKETNEKNNIELKESIDNTSKTVESDKDTTAQITENNENPAFEVTENNEKPTVEVSENSKNDITEVNGVKIGETKVIFIDNAWRMLVNGVIDYNYNGLGTNENGMWYVKDGTIKFDYTGTYFQEDKAYIVEGNKVVATIAKDTTKVMMINEKWRMVVNGEVLYNYEGIGKNENGTWYLKNGTIDFNLTGVFKSQTGTYVVERNSVKTDLNKVMLIENSWRMVKQGKVDYNYEGIGTNENGTWYLKDGTIKFDYTGTYYEADKAYIVEGNKVVATVSKDTTQVMLVDNVWRMVKDGKVLYDYNGIGTNKDGTWYVKNGTIDFKYTGKYTDETGTYIVEKNEVMVNTNRVMLVDNVWRMVKDGKVILNYNGIGTNKDGTWYVKDGTIKFDYTGTYYEGDKAYIIEENKVVATVSKDTTQVMLVDNVWRMVKEGKVIYNYNGIGINKDGTWYVRNGTIDFKYTGSFTDETGTYIVKENKIVNDVNKVMLVDNVWRMVKNGQVVYDYNGLGTNKDGTWYVKDGTIKFDYTGTYFEGDKAYIIEENKLVATLSKDTTQVMIVNEKWRMVINGEVRYNYDGLGANKDGIWYVKNGTIDFKYSGIYKDETGTYIIEKNEFKKNLNKVMMIENNWRMVVNGKVDYNYEGLGKNENGTWYLKDGTIKFDYADTYFEGDKAYIIERNQVYAIVTKTTTKVMYINDTWRMVVNGKVDYNYNGLGTNENGTWLVQNGKVNLKYKGTYQDEYGNIFGIRGSEVREILNNVNYPGTMNLESPIEAKKYISDSITIEGWALSEEMNDTILIYVDNKYIGKAERKYRQDVFNAHKDEFGGSTSNPYPGFYYNLSTALLSIGTHRVKVVNIASDGKTEIQSREVEFKITNLSKTLGIDVSHYQGDIDWNAVRNSGINFAILKIGEYRESTGTVIVDSRFERNYQECKRLGISVGGYFYSYAFNGVEADHEANACLSIINGKSFELPIFLDVEDRILTNISREELTNASITFCDKMISAGHKAGVYASKNFFRDHLNASILERYHIWLAHYTTETDYSGRFDLWQYTSSGSVPGIAGNVDMDWCFIRY